MHDGQAIPEPRHHLHRLYEVNCLTTSEKTKSYEVTDENCDPSYREVCIPPPPPDLNCGDIEFTDLAVIGSDPHRFDTDNDGTSCES